MCCEASSSLSDPVGAEPPPVGLWVSVYGKRSSEWPRKGDELAKSQRRSAGNPVGPEPGGISCPLPDEGLVGRGPADR